MTFLKYAVTVGVLALIVSVPARSQTSSNPAVVGALNQVVSSHFGTAGSRGMVVAVTFPDGSVFETARGTANAQQTQALTPDHHLGFASITKTFVAASILQMVEDGSLGLATRVSDTMTPPQNVNAVITIRQLLGHESGLFNYTNSPNLMPRLLSDTSRVWTPEAMMIEFVGPSVFFPGFGASYSNTNYMMLEMMAEAVQDRSLGQHMRDRVLDPFNLNTMVFGPEEHPRGEVPVTWHDVNGDGRLDNFSGFYASTSLRTGRSAAGGMMGTARDVAMWARHLYTGSVLTETMRDQMLTFHDLVGQNATWTGYGLGAQQYAFSGIEFWGHSGLISGSASLMLYSPELDVSIAMVDVDARSQPFGLAQSLVSYLSTVTFTGVEGVPDRVLTQRAVYPNPVAPGGVLTLERNTGVPEAADLTIVDVLGRTLYRATLNASDTAWTWSVPDGLPTGTVLYRLISPSGSHSGVLAIRP